METVLSSSFLGAFAAREWQRTRPKRKSSPNSTEAKSNSQKNYNDSAVTEVAQSIMNSAEHRVASEKSNDISLLSLTPNPKEDNSFSVGSASGSLSARDWSPTTKEMASFRMPRHQLLEAMAQHEISMREIIKEKAELEKKIRDLQSQLELAKKAEVSSRSSLNQAGVELNCLRSAIQDCLQENKILETNVKALQTQAIENVEVSERLLSLQNEVQALKDRLSEEQQARSAIEAANKILNLEISAHKLEAADRSEESVLRTRISELEQAHGLISKLQEERQILRAMLARQDSDMKQAIMDGTALSDENMALRREILMWRQVAYAVPVLASAAIIFLALNSTTAHLIVCGALFYSTSLLADVFEFFFLFSHYSFSYSSSPSTKPSFFEGIHPNSGITARKLITFSLQNQNPFDPECNTTDTTAASTAISAAISALSSSIGGVEAVLNTIHAVTVTKQQAASATRWGIPPGTPPSRLPTTLGSATRKSTAPASARDHARDAQMSHHSSPFGAATVSAENCRSHGSISDATSVLLAGPNEIPPSIHFVADSFGDESAVRRLAFEARSGATVGCPTNIPQPNRDRGPAAGLHSKLWAPSKLIAISPPTKTSPPTSLSNSCSAAIANAASRDTVTVENSRPASSNRPAAVVPVVVAARVSPISPPRLSSAATQQSSDAAVPDRVLGNGRRVWDKGSPGDSGSNSGRDVEVSVANRITFCHGTVADDLSKGAGNHPAERPSFENGGEDTISGVMSLVSSSPSPGPQNFSQNLDSFQSSESGFARSNMLHRRLSRARGRSHGGVKTAERLRECPMLVAFDSNIDQHFSVALATSPIWTEVGSDRPMQVGRQLESRPSESPSRVGVQWRSQIIPAQPSLSPKLNLDVRPSAVGTPRHSVLTQPDSSISESPERKARAFASVSTENESWGSNGKHESWVGIAVANVSTAMVGHEAALWQSPGGKGRNGRVLVTRHDGLLQELDLANDGIAFC